MTKAEWNQSVVSREEHRQQKRDAVLQVGAKLFNDRGYENTTLDDIALELNISKRTIYYYVQNKEDILFECIRGSLEFMQGVAKELADGEGSVVERINLLTSQYMIHISTDIGACIVLTQLASLSESRRDEIRKSMSLLDNLLADLVRQGIDEGIIKPIPSRMITAAIFGAINWTARWNRNSAVTDQAELAGVFSGIFLDGILTTKSAS